MSVVVTPEAVNPDQIVAEAERALADIARIKESIGTVIFGQESVIERTLVAVLAGGHALLVGVPGLAKPSWSKHWERCLAFRASASSSRPT